MNPIHGPIADGQATGLAGLAGLDLELALGVGVTWLLFALVVLAGLPQLIAAIREPKGTARSRET